MYCNYKLSKYQSKDKSTHVHKIKYNYYKNMVGGFNSVPFKYIETLDSFINSYNEDAKKINSLLQPDDIKKLGRKIIDPSHGLEHALMVLCHAEKALESYKQNGGKISEQDELNVKLAALLHDIDDHKYFKNNNNFENARHILMSSGLDNDNIEEIVKMISWVSSSINGDRIPDEVSKSGKYYMLYPRYSDRLEAIGIIGLERTLEYTLKQNAPLSIDKKPTPDMTIKQIYNEIATPERYASYSGESISMMDHFYDKLLRLGKYPIRNEYFDEQCTVRQKPLEDIAVRFEQHGTISEDEVRKYIKDNEHIGTSCSCNSEVVKYIKDNRIYN